MWLPPPAAASVYPRNTVATTWICTGVAHRATNGSPHSEPYAGGTGAKRAPDREVGPPAFLEGGPEALTLGIFRTLTVQWFVPFFGRTMGPVVGGVFANPRSSLKWAMKSSIWSEWIFSLPSGDTASNSRKRSQSVAT